MYVVVPGQIDVSDIRRKALRSGLNDDLVFYTASILFMKPAFDYELYKDMMKNNNFFIHLYSPILKKQIRYDYAKYIKFLLDNDIWEVYKDGSYFSGGGYGKAYKFKAPYYLGVGQMVPVQEKNLAKQLKSFNIDRTSALKYPNLYRWLGSRGLEIDLESCKAKIMQVKDAENKSDFWANIALTRVAGIANHQYWFHVGDSGRLTTNLTGINKILREFITYKGQKLVEVDISNSQPFLLIHLLNKAYSIPKGYDGKPSEYLHGRRVGDFSDLDLYYWLVETGNLYAHVFLEKKASKKPGFAKALFDDKRRLIKDQVLKLFMGDPEAHPTLSKEFAGIFPTVYEVMERYRKRSTSELKWSESKQEFYSRRTNNKLAMALQGLEAKIVLDGVCHKFHVKYPDVPLFTIHDCLVTVDGYQAPLREILKTECHKAVGRVPEIKGTKWETENIESV